MSSSDMDVQKYLDRIGASAPAQWDLEALRSIHTRHLMSVPFEDLTQHSGGRVVVHRPTIYDKIVTRRRGGFCCELNGLFSWLVSSLGYPVTIHSAQVMGTCTGQYDRPFGHLIFSVVLQGHRWLCDVAMGRYSFLTPLSLETDGPQVRDHRVYRIRPQGGLLFLEWQDEQNQGPDRDWRPLYKFTLTPRSLDDFHEMCDFHQRSPCSLFFCKSLCIIFKPGGMVKFIGRRLTTTVFPTEGEGGMVETTRELKDEEIPDVLAKEFGIVLDSPLIPKDEAVTPHPVEY